MYRLHIRALLMCIILVGIISYLGYSAHLTIAAATTHPEPTHTLALAVPDSEYPLFWFTPKLPLKYVPTRISSVAFDPSHPGVALAASGNSDEGLLRTTNSGVTWTVLSAPNPSDTRFSYHVIYGEQPETFYAWGGNLLYKTTNSGASWTKLPYGPWCEIAILIVHPTKPNILYVGTTYSFAWSFDGGQTWGQNGMGCTDLPVPYTIDVGIDQPDVVYAGQLGYGGGVFRSADRGKTWSIVNNGLPYVTDIGGAVAGVKKIVVDPRNADIVFALTEHDGVYKTTNGGGVWALLDKGVEGLPLRWLVLDPQTYTLYSASDNYIYFLPDGAQQWQKRLSDPIPQPASFPEAPMFSISPANKNNIIVYNSNGIFVGLPARGRIFIPTTLQP